MCNTANSNTANNFFTYFFLGARQQTHNVFNFLCDGPKIFQYMLGGNNHENLKCESNKAETILEKILSAQVLDDLV